ncbi:MAG: hypothetical protein JRI25_03825 [Deltaproteobacteria bacterium]|nr:hypothetical protein [Deltaproteobacteria bacterium]
MNHRLLLHITGLASMVATAPARAERPLLYAGDPDVAVHRVAAATGEALWDLEPVRLGDLLTGDVPVTMGTEQPAPCTASVSTNLEMIKTISQVERQIAHQEFVEASGAIDHATSAQACLSEIVEPTSAARLFFLRGIVAQALHDDSTAESAFLRALSYQPALEWDDAFKPDWRPAFDRAGETTQSAAPGTMLLGPTLENTDALWVDGRIVTPDAGRVSLPEGTHLVQIPGATVITREVAIRSGQSVALLVPGALTEDLLAGAADPEEWPLLEAILDDALPEEDRLYLWTGTHTLDIGDEWVVFPEPPPDESIARRNLGSKLTTGGSVALGAGVLASGIGLALWAPNHRGKDADTQDDFTHMTNMASAGDALLTAGAVSVGTGLVTSIVGAMLARKPKAAPPAAVAQEGD